jgi:hypothetical protein
MEKSVLLNQSISFWKVFTTYTGCQNKFVFKTLRKNVTSSLKGFVWKAWDFWFFTFGKCVEKGTIILIYITVNFCHLQLTLNTTRWPSTLVQLMIVEDCLFVVFKQGFFTSFPDFFFTFCRWLYWWVRFQAGRRSYSSTVRFPSSISLMFPYSSKKI